MDFLSASLYGVIQGLTEFLPVSSSGHLALMPYVLKIKDPGVAFDLAMHVGTALAILCYFFKEVKVLLMETFKLPFNNSTNSAMRFYSINLLISTVTTVILALVFKGHVQEIGRNKNLIAFNLLFFGILMFLADYFNKNNSSNFMRSKVQVSKSFGVGFCQAMALFPGVSRSGATLTISRFLKLSREEATRFSFLLSLPLILGGFIIKFPELQSANEAFSIEACVVGVLVSFFVGLLTIHFFLKLIKKIGFGYFALYRVVLAGIIFFYA